MSEQPYIREIVSELQADRTVCTNHVERMSHILRHFAAKAIPVAVCADARHLDRSVSTLKKYDRELNLIFPDYTPRHLREKPSK